MQATIDLPDDVYSAVRALGDLRGLSLGDALTELVRRGLARSVGIDTTKAFPCFDLSGAAEPITLERTLAAEDDL